jgi:cyclic-di-AMP phosphodiesterase PgpH
MLNLEFLGLGRKKKGYFPDRKVRAAQQSGIKNNPIVKALIIITFLALLIIFFPGSGFRDFTYKLGEPWRDDDLTAPFTFSLLKDREELREEITEIRTSTPPIFYQNHAVPDNTIATLDSLYGQITAVLNQYVLWQRSKEIAAPRSAADSLLYTQLRYSSELRLSEAAWRTLQNQYIRALGNDLSLPQSPVTRFIGNDMRLIVSRTMRDLHQDGVIDNERATLNTREIILRDTRDRTQRSVAIASLRDMNDSREFALNRFQRAFDAEVSGIAFMLFDASFQANLILNEDESELAVREAIESVSPTKGAITAGQMIIRKGDLITQERLIMLQSLEAARASRATDLDIWQHYLGNTIILLAIFLFYLMYLYLYRNPIFDHNGMLLLVLIALGLVIGFAVFVMRVEVLSIYLIPIAIAPIILTIIFDSRVGLMTTTTLALTIAFMSGNDFEYVVAATTASSIAVYSVRDIKNRSQFFLTTPALVFLSYAIILIGFTLIKPTGWSTLGNQLLFVVGNAVFIWLTYPLILLFEKIFKVTTEVSLLELNNNNHPLLKALMTRAPGTFQHSLQVANLAEAAASAINANSLLSRVGAMYHDIGKMEKPEYFVENQFGENEHDKLKPRMSAMVIKNHVATGIKMAKEANLPDVVIDFIRTHHGNSLIKFFHDKALKSSANEGEIREEDFRYDGPLPNSKETGILLLADAVEASSRAMSDPSYQKLENLVNRIVDERLDEGQLNNCALTYQDIRIIKENFLGILVGVYHSRVKYPGQDEKDNKGIKKGHSEIHADAAGQSQQHPSGSD